MPEALKMRYVKSTRPCLNTKLLHILRGRHGLKYHWEFNLSGAGLHTTFVLVLSANSCVPAGARKYFSSCVMQAGIDALDENSKTVSHGVPQTDNFDGTQTLELFAEDLPTVWRCVDEYLRARKKTR
ncbi:hypothetical protein JTB14_020897 [Gonioctena quinquepunctata]|nr:hypothetical protein JTB14_020897 [Gonioctena quinquepunctata]